MLDRLTIERMMTWTGDKPVLVALSGGGDSVALLHLLTAELGAHCVRAAVVDHGLRDGSSIDARRAKGFAEALGVSADVLTLSWEGDANRAQQAAREARYGAICAYARGADLNTIVAAHTADDQAETVLMRAANGSTWRGLAGIATFAFAPIWPEGRGLALARPLLGARREALRVYLGEQRAEWIEDPANSNTKFERVRVRARLRELENDGADPMRLVRLAARLRARTDKLDHAALGLISRAATLGLTVSVSRAAWTAPREVRCRALSVLIAAVSGASREPSWSDVEDLETRVMRVDHRGETHSGVEFAPSINAVILRRERGAVLGRADGVPPRAALALTTKDEAIWDGRLSITAPEPGWRVVPAHTNDLVAFEKGLEKKRYADVEAALQLRPLAAARVAHAFAPDINRAKP